MNSKNAQRKILNHFQALPAQIITAGILGIAAVIIANLLILGEGLGISSQLIYINIAFTVVLSLAVFLIFRKSSKTTYLVLAILILLIAYSIYELNKSLIFGDIEKIDSPSIVILYSKPFGTFEKKTKFIAGINSIPNYIETERGRIKVVKKNLGVTIQENLENLLVHKSILSNSHVKWVIGVVPDEQGIFIQASDPISLRLRRYGLYDVIILNFQLAREAPITKNSVGLIDELTEAVKDMNPISNQRDISNLQRTVVFGFGRFSINIGVDLRVDDLNEESIGMIVGAGTNETGDLGEVFDFNKKRQRSFLSDEITNTSYINFAPNLAAIVYQSVANYQRDIGERSSACVTLNKSVEFTAAYGKVQSDVFSSIKQNYLWCLYYQGKIAEALNLSVEYDSFDEGKRFRALLDQLIVDLIIQKYQKLPNLQSILPLIPTEQLRSELSYASRIYDQCAKNNDMADYDYIKCKVNYLSNHGERLATTDTVRGGIFAEYTRNYLRVNGFSEAIWKFSDTIRLNKESACRIFGEVWFNQIFVRKIILIVSNDFLHVEERLKNIVDEVNKYKCQNIEEEVFVKIVIQLHKEFSERRAVVESLFLKLKASENGSEVNDVPGNGIEKLIRNLSEVERGIIVRLFSIFLGLDISKYLDANAGISFASLVESEFLPRLQLAGPKTDSLQKILLSFGRIADKVNNGKPYLGELIYLNQLIAKFVDEINVPEVNLIHLMHQVRSNTTNRGQFVSQIDEFRKNYPNHELTDIFASILYEKAGAYKRALTALDAAKTLYGDNEFMKLKRAKILFEVDKKIATTEFEKLIRIEKDLLRRDYYKYLFKVISGIQNDRSCVSIGGLTLSDTDISMYEEFYKFADDRNLYDYFDEFDAVYKEYVPSLQNQIAMELQHQKANSESHNNRTFRLWKHINLESGESNLIDPERRGEKKEVLDSEGKFSISDNSSGALYRVLRDVLLFQNGHNLTPKQTGILETLEVDETVTIDGVRVIRHEYCEQIQ